MAWQRFNRTTNVFEVSDDNGGSWQTLVIAAAGLGVAALPSNLAYIDRGQTFLHYQTIQTDPRYAGDASLFLDNPVAATYKNFRLMSYADNFRIWNENSRELLTIDGAGGAVHYGDVHVGSASLKGNLWTTYPIYPGRMDVGPWTEQTSWYLASHGSYGLYTNTGLFTAGPINSTSAGGNQLADLTVGATNFYAGVLISGGYGLLIYQGLASADGRAMDHYEEGTWTPTMVSNAGGQGTAYVSQAGTYTRIGNFVICNFTFNIQSADWASGYVLITGMPFNNGDQYGAGIFDYYQMAPNIITLKGHFPPNVNYMYMPYKVGASTVAWDGLVTVDQVVGNTVYRGTVIYRTAT